MEKISIIIPVYNGEKFLRETVEAIQKSYYKNLEIILIDDGSTDHSYQICKSLAEEDDRIVISKQKNQGIAATRNRGIRMSKGEWIAFCDQDDIVDARIYNLLLQRVLKDKSDIAICGTGKLINKQYEPFEIFEDAVYEKKEIVEQAMYSILFDGYKIDNISSLKIKMGNCIWKCLIKKSLLSEHEISFKQFINFEDDRTFLLDILSVANRVSLLKECLYFWRINLQSETYRKKYIEDIDKKMSKYQEYEVKIFRRAGIQQAVISQYFQCENCNNYVQLIENERGISNPRSLKEKIRYLERIIYTPSFKKNIKAKKKLKKNVIKKKIVLLLIEKHLLYLAYFFDICYVELKTRALKYKAITIIERKAERKNR